MNKKINDTQLDNMLKSYCKRDRQHAFEVALSQEKSNKKQFRFIPAIAFTLALTLAFGFLILSPAKSTTSNVPKGFSVSASASEREAVKLDSVKVELCPKEERGLGGDITFEDGMVSLEPIWFYMNGDDIETFDYKCENGLLYYVIPDLKNEKLEGNEEITQDDYFKKGKELKQIPYDGEKENHIFVSWFSMKLDEEAQKYFNTDISLIDDETMRNYRKEHLKNDEDFTRYFGDTITITAHYKDGTSETAVIEVTVDTKKSENTTYGNYVLKYR